MSTRTYEPPSALRILHVAESFGGGVGSALLDYVMNTPEFEHHLLYAEREDAPIAVDQLHSFESATRLPDGHLQRVRATRGLVRNGAFNLVHGHSSFGGLYARAAVRKSERPIVYTPHCYAFERRDVAHINRAAYRLAEFLLSFNTSVYAACSPREARLSRWIGSRSVVFVPNVPPPVERRKSTYERSDGPLEVVGAGRSATQKDPEYFIECIRAARAAGASISATWIGGDERLRAAASRDDITVTGWLPRGEALQRLEQADIYLHTAAWEGFPVAVLEAVSLGIPTVVRSIPAFASIDLPKIDTPTDFVALIRASSDPAYLAAVLKRGEQALTSFSVPRQREALLAAYAPEGSR